MGGDKGVAVELVPCHVDKAMYMLFVKDYIETLRGYDREIAWDEHEAEKWIWDAKFIVHDGVLCGFIILQEFKFKKAKDLLYIAEMYVEKEEREKGVGIEAVKVAVDGWNGEVFLYVLDGNEGGKAFWDAVEKELGWERTDRADVRRERGCELRVYRV